MAGKIGGDLEQGWAIGSDNPEAYALEVNASRWLGHDLLNLALLAIIIAKASAEYAALIYQY